MTNPSHPQDLDLDFDTLLTLEDTLYTTAYTHGAQDGARAGRIEGRIFGLEKGFEKYSAMGVLHGRSSVWGSRLAPSTSTSTSTSTLSQNADIALKEEEEGVKDTLPSLPANPRLEKHIKTLHALTDPLTFSTSNTEDSVADFDDRVKRGGAKAKIVEKTVHEGENDAGGGARSPRKGVRGVKIMGEKKQGDSMEDFAGSRLLA